MARVLYRIPPQLKWGNHPQQFAYECFIKVRTKNTNSVHGEANKFKREVYPANRTLQLPSRATESGV